MRITRKFLEAKVAYLNQYLGQSTEAWTKQADGRYRANVGTYVLNHNSIYGGYCLNRICTEGGGQSPAIGSKRVPASQMADLISAFLEGMLLENERLDREYAEIAAHLTA
jgi:hypothetical protein